MKSLAGLHERTEESTKNLGVRRPWDAMGWDGMGSRGGKKGSVESRVVSSFCYWRDGVIQIYRHTHALVYTQRTCGPPMESMRSVSPISTLSTSSHTFSLYCAVRSTRFE